MKRKQNTLVILILSILVIFALILGTSPTNGSTSAQAMEDYPLDEVKHGYQLTHLTWQVSGEVSGGGYSLQSPSSPTLRGNGCCCTYLPCVLNKK
jgi:hypothetical protein